MIKLDCNAVISSSFSIIGRIGINIELPNVMIKGMDASEIIAHRLASGSGFRLYVCFMNFSSSQTCFVLLSASKDIVMLLNVLYPTIPLASSNKLKRLPQCFSRPTTFSFDRLNLSTEDRTNRRLSYGACDSFAKRRKRRLA